MAAPQGRRRHPGGAGALNPRGLNGTELRALLLDCLALWDVAGRVEAMENGISVTTAEGNYLVRPADAALRPVRWFLQTPERAAAGMAPRATPSIGALLSTLRNHLGAGPGERLRVGPVQA